MYLIWSMEHRGWWKPQACGYTQDIAKAGHFTLAEGTKIVNDANINLGSRTNYPEECLVPVPEALQ